MKSYFSNSYTIFVIAFLITGTLPGAIAADTFSPAATVVGGLQQALIDTDLRLGGDAGFAARVAAFAPLVESSHDLPYMARITIGRAWKNVAASQRVRFVEAFRQLSVATYASRFRDMAGTEFRTVGERALDGGRIEVKTELVEANGDRTALDYVLQATGDGWRIVNILAQGVSDLALSRSQYGTILREQSFDALIEHLEARTRALAAEG